MFGTLSDALAEDSESLKQMIVLVTAVSVEKEKQQGFIAVVDTSVKCGAEALILVQGSFTTFLPSLNPGSILLLNGVKKCKRSRNFEKRYDFRLSTTSAVEGERSLKVVNEDDLQDAIRHEDAHGLIDLSHQVRNRCVARPSCRLRRLQDIQDPGMLSSVEARVINISTVFPKRRAKKGLGPRSQAIVTLLDGDVCMMLLDCQKHITDMKTAKQTGQCIKITNLLSCRNSEGDIVLKPTIKTVVVFQGKFALDDRKLASSEVTVVEQPVLDGSTLVVARLEAISIDELDKPLSSFITPSSFSDLVVNPNPHPTYRAATFSLEGSLVVKASPAVVRSLCASIDAQKLISHPTIRLHVLEFVKGLLVGHHRLNWTLNRGRKVVLHVELPRL